MGSFSYICAGCGQPISGEEKCVLIHVRHGKELGRAVGTYYDYGRVEEDDVFRSIKLKGINSHEEICKSEFDLEDSETKSGISAWHQVCFKEGNLSLSEIDPNQGWGEPKNKYKITVPTIAKSNYKNYVMKIEQKKVAIVDVVAASDVEAEQIIGKMWENNLIDLQEDITSLSCTNIKVEDTDVVKEQLIRNMVNDFDNLTPNQIRQKAKELNYNPDEILDEIKLRVEGGVHND